MRPHGGRGEATPFAVGMSHPLVRVGRQGGEPRVLDGRPHGKMVEILELVAREPRELMDRVVEVAADPRPPAPDSLRLQVEELADQSRLPEEVPLKPGAIPLQ
jgi:hypothetical protein